MAIDTNARSSVSGLTFELLKDVPETPIPLLAPLGEDYLKALVGRYPDATLQNLCRIVQLDWRISIRPQTMCKLLTRVGFGGATPKEMALQLVSAA